MKQNGHNIFVFYFCKIDHNFELARSILMKLVASRVKHVRIEIRKARGPGKFCRPRSTWVKVGDMTRISRELFTGSTFFELFRFSGLTDRSRDMDDARESS